MAEAELIIDLDAEVAEPTWGERLQFMRQRQWSGAPALAADLAAVGISTTPATISRIESETEVPSSASRRRVATATMLLMKRDPATMGLDSHELPEITLWAIARKVGAPDPGGPEAPGRTPPGTRTQNLRIIRSRTVVPLRTAA